LTDTIAVEIGFNANQLGVLAALSFLFSALVVIFLPKLTEKFNNKLILFISNLIMIIGLLLYPYLGIIIGGIFLILNISTISSYEVISSVMLNKRIDSKYRATALSVFAMLKKIPYIFLAYSVGVYIDKFSAISVGVIIGICLFLISIVFIPKLNGKN
jgi:MFS-type transporter involved in bile tolerance (Atg22 family)